MTYRKDTKTMLYRSKMNPNLKRNFARFPVLDWIAAITAYIPNKGGQLIRYYGTYSNVSRGKRKKEKPKRGEAVTWKTEVTEVPPPLVSKELKKRWSYFIQKVYETHPLICLKWALALPLRPTPGRHNFPTIRRMQFNSSLIASWRLNTEQSQAQSGSKPI